MIPQENQTTITREPIQIIGRIFIATVQNTASFPKGPDFTYFTIDDDIQYIGFCDDFGPMNLGCVYRFCDILDEKLEIDLPPTDARKKVALCTPPDKRAMTNAVFLLGAYLIMRLHWQPSAVDRAFANLNHMLIPFRDVSPAPPTFSLHLRDCWEGMWKARRAGWVSFEGDWFSLADYEHCDSPLNADLHEVVRGKFVAMRGPKSLAGGATYQDRASGARDFSPAHYVEILRQFDVEVVVRLNEGEYEDSEFEAQGIMVVSLAFPDCTVPPPDVVAKFLAVAEAVPGAMAVHCKAGLGRTGTMIALYMMKHHGFTAREAMGWLRVVRPGSVMGDQQQYLCDSEAEMHAAGRLFRARNPAVAAVVGGVVSGFDSESAPAVRRVADVRAAVDRAVTSVDAAASNKSP